MIKKRTSLTASEMPNYPLRLNGSVMASVKRAADREDTSVNKMIEILLREALKARNMRIVGPRSPD